MGAVYQLNPTSGMTQCQKIVKHVAEHGGITAWEAINSYGITRLAARVHELAGTPDEMRAEDIGDGYVRYVPNWNRRLKALTTDMQLLIFTSSNSEIARRLPPMVVEFNNAYRATLRNGSW